MIEQALQQILTNDATVSALIGTRVYPNIAPQGASYPYVIYSRVSSTRDWTLSGAVGRTVARVQVDSRSRTFPEARTLGQAVRDALENYSGTVNVGSPATAFVIKALRQDSDQDLPDDETDPRTFRVRADYFVTFDD